MEYDASHDRWRNVRYGGAAFALGMPTIPLLVHLPAIYAEQIGLGLTATGIALFAARLFDVVTDPLIGFASDRLSTRWGRWKPLILVGGLIGAVGTIFLLNPLSDAGALYLALWAAILYLGWTLVSIPYLAWGAALSSDYNGRTHVTSTREAFMLCGIVVAGAVPALAALAGYGERAAVGFIGWVVIGLGAVLFAILLKTVKEPARPTLHKAEHGLRALIELSSNKPFRLLAGGWFVNSLANGIPAVLFILYMKHVLETDELQRGILTFAYFVAGVAGIPLWMRLSDRWGKHQTWCAAMALACTGFVFVPFLGAGDFIAFFIITLVTGVTLGADLAIPPSMQADVAEYELFRSRRDRTSLLFAFWSMITKIAFALSVLIAFPTLEFAGFSTEGPDGEQNLMALAVIYAGVPVVLKAIAIGIVWQHPLTSQKQDVLRRRLTALATREVGIRP